MKKSDKVRRMMAKAQITGMDEEKLIKQVMKSCEFTRSLAVTYIRKNKGTAALRETLKAMREKLGDATPAKAAKTVKVEGKRGPGRPRKTEVAPVVQETTAVPNNLCPFPTSIAA